MSSDDDILGTAFWLAAGGAAGYAAGRFLVAPKLAKQSPPPSASSHPEPAPRPAATLRALAASPQPLDGSFNALMGPSGDMHPIDPYASAPLVSFVPATGPSGSPQPIDPYADATMKLVTPAPSTSSSPVAPPGNGPTTPPTLEIGPVALGPVPPSQHPTSAAPFATSVRVRRFDPVYRRYCGNIPIEYVRALVERESNGQPSVRAGSAIGLMQIVPVVLADYNKRHGSAYTSEHLADPATNVAIGCELLRIIIASYRKNHPRIRTLQTDWGNPEFVALLTLGWNAGFSEAAGLGRVARYLENLGAIDIDIDQVAAHARLAGATKHLANPAKIAWCKSVVALYQRERALRATPAS